MKRLLLAACCVLWAITCYAQTTAIRPDQIGAGTPDITWKPGGPGYQIGTTVPWRTDSTTTPAFTSADGATVVELTNAGAITAALPDTTLGPTGMSDGFGFTIQVAAGTLTLSVTGATNKINGLNSIKVGSYQTISLLLRGGKWYANLGVPQPAVQTGGTVLCDNMKWAASCAPVVPGIAFVQGNGGSTASAAGVTTQSTTLPSNVTAGNFIVALTSGYYTAAFPTALTVTASGQTCYHAANTYGHAAGTQAVLTDISFCPNAVAGPVTVTVTATSNTMDYIELLAAEFSGVTATSGADISLGGTYSATTPAPSLTTGATTQANQLTVSVLTPATSNPTSTTGSANQIAFPSSVGNRLASYQIVNTSGAGVTHSWAAASQFFGASIAVFSHP